MKINTFDRLLISCVMALSVSQGQGAGKTVNRVASCRPNKLRGNKGNSELYYQRTGEILKYLLLPNELLSQQ